MQNDRNNTKPRQISSCTGGLIGRLVSSIPSPSTTINLARILGSPSNIDFPLQYPSTSEEMRKKMQLQRLEEIHAKHLIETAALINTLEPPQDLNKSVRKSGNIFRHTEKLFSSDTRQSMKRRIVTERLTEIYSQMQIHVIGCV